MTKIEWTQRPGTKGETLNPIRARINGGSKTGWFCEHVSEGCRNCYAEAMNRWRGNALAYKAQNRAKVEIYLDEKTLLKPLKWRKPRTIFWCSMTDLFGDFLPERTTDACFAVMALTPQHTHQVLTKRSARQRAYLNGSDRQTRWIEVAKAFGAAGRLPAGVKFQIAEPLPNVWLGVSVEDQAAADQRVPQLLDTPAAVRFLSCEPLLGPVSLLRWLPIESCAPSKIGIGLDWVICGGESGRRARPMHPDWARDLRGQCQGAGVPFFFKQWGAWSPEWPGELPSRDKAVLVTTAGLQEPGLIKGDYPTVVVRRPGKTAGNRLDGYQHLEFPRAAP